MEPTCLPGKYVFGLEKWFELYKNIAHSVGSANCLQASTTETIPCYIISTLASILVYTAEAHSWYHKHQIEHKEIFFVDHTLLTM